MSISIANLEKELVTLQCKFKYKETSIQNKGHIRGFSSKFKQSLEKTNETVGFVKPSANVVSVSGYSQKK
jgi:hypothetical protein